jgi:hypothetical protein
MLTYSFGSDFEKKLPVWSDLKPIPSSLGFGEGAYFEARNRAQSKLRRNVFHPWDGGLLCFPMYR